MIGKQGVFPPLMMMIDIFACVPFMGIMGFIIGPVLVTFAVTRYKILAEAVENSKNCLPKGDFCDY
jgi:predicted PurR-regulated permease PerM